MPAERTRGLQDRSGVFGIAGIEFLQGRRRGRVDRRENAEQGVGVAVLVTDDQLRVVEVVARVQPDPAGRARRNATS